MKSSYLLPHKYKPLGWILLGLGLVSGIAMLANGYESDLLTIKVLAIYNDISLLGNETVWFSVQENSIIDELTAIFIIIGGLIVGFSKEKIEDEFIYKLRTESLVWALIVNYIILLFTIIFFYDLMFFHVMVFNMFTPILFFIIRFNFLKIKSSKL